MVYQIRFLMTAKYLSGELHHQKICPSHAKGEKDYPIEFWNYDYGGGALPFAGSGSETPEFVDTNNDVDLAYKRSKGEMSDFHNDNYNYKKGKGWVKDELNEAVARAIHKYLR